MIQDYIGFSAYKVDQLGPLNYVRLRRDEPGFANEQRQGSTWYGRVSLLHSLFEATYLSLFVGEAWFVGRLCPAWRTGTGD